MVFGVLTVAAWLVWAIFTLSLLVELVAAIRGVQAPHITFAGPLQRTARALVAAIVLAFTLSHGQPASFAAAPQRMPPLPTRASAHVIEMPQPLRLPADAPDIRTDTDDGRDTGLRCARSNDHRRAWRQRVGPGRGAPRRWSSLARAVGAEPRPAAARRRRLDRPAGHPHGLAAPAPRRRRVRPVVPPVVETATSPTTYEVVTGDTLSGIAETQLGDASRYREIFELNRGREQPDGRRLTDPNLIVTGWRLELPSIGGAPSPAPAPTVEVPPAESAPAEPVPVPAIDESAATPADAPTTTAPPAPVTVSPSSDAGTSPPFTSMPERTEPASTAADSAEIDDESWWATKAPLLVGVSGATVLATGLLLRLRRASATPLVAWRVRGPDHCTRRRACSRGRGRRAARSVGRPSARDGDVAPRRPQRSKERAPRGGAVRGRRDRSAVGCAEPGRTRALGGRRRRLGVALALRPGCECSRRRAPSSLAGAGDDRHPRRPSAPRRPRSVRHARGHGRRRARR